MSSFRLLSRISGWALGIRAPVQKARDWGLKSVSLTSLTRSSLIPTTIKSSSQLYSTSSQTHTHTHQSRSFTSSPSNDNSPDFIAWSQIPSSLHPALNQFSADNDKDGFISYLQDFGPLDMNVALDQNAAQQNAAWIYARRQSQLQSQGFEKAVLDKIHIYGPRDGHGDFGDNAKDILFDDSEWKTALNDLWVKLEDEDKLVTIHGISSREVVAQDFRKNIQFVINKNPREMRLNEAASGVGKTTLINGLVKVIAESRSDLVAAVIPMQKIAEELGSLYADPGLGFRFVPFIENVLDSAYPAAGCIKYVIIDDIEQIFHYQWVGAFLGGLGTRTDPGDRKKYATWDFCGSSLLSHALLSKNGAYFADKTHQEQEYKYWNEGIKINGRRLSKTPSLTNCVSINEFKILFKSIAATSKVTLPADDDEYEWISLFWKTGGHPDTMYKLIKHKSTKDIVTNIFNKLENEIAENAEYDVVMKKVIGQYWSFWDGFGDDIHRKENEPLLPSPDQTINEWFEYRANQNMAWIDPTRANGVHRSEFVVKEHVLRRMEDRGMILVRDSRVFPAFPYFALISLREPTLDQDVKSFYSQLTKCRDEITAWLELFTFKIDTK